MGSINLMGIELEGAWVGERRKRPFFEVKIKHDGSVRFHQPSDGTFLHHGEIVSKPMSAEELLNFIDQYCPTHANESAGTHIHVSLKSNGMYGSLLTPAFQRKLISAYTQYNETIKTSDPVTYLRFAKRLAGGNRYCMKAYKGLDQIVTDHKNSVRYQMINYCYRLHGTIEIRVLPCTTNKEFLKGLVLLTRDVIEGWVRDEFKSTKVRFRRQ